MKERLIDKSNPKNIYCAHCEHWSGYTDGGFGDARCNVTDEVKEYFHRCKFFEWKKDGKYKE